MAMLCIFALMFKNREPLMKVIVFVGALILSIVSVSPTYAQSSILNAENLEWYFPEAFAGMERGSLTRRKTEAGHKMINTSFLILSPEMRITSSVLVFPAVITLEHIINSSESTLKQRYPTLKKLGNKVQRQTINGEIFEYREAAFQIEDHIFGRKQATFMLIAARKKGDEIIELKARSPINEWQTTPIKIRALMNRITSPQE